MLLPAPNKINELSQIHFVGSPLHVSIPTGVISPGQYVVLFLWVWTGNITTPYNGGKIHNFTFSAAPINDSDGYVIFEISEYIKGFINPTIVYDTYPLIGNEGAFFQYGYEIRTQAGVVTTTVIKPTSFATLGYNWSYENQDTFAWNNGSFGKNTSTSITDTVPLTPDSGTIYRSYSNNMVDKYYSPYIQYYQTKIKLNSDTSNGVIYRETLVPTNNIRCAKEPYLILYISKLGTWEYFTPNGKVSISTKVSRDKYQKAIKNPKMFNSEYDYSVTQKNISSSQSYVINTGYLTEAMGQLVEEIIYSPKVYLVKFENSLSLPGLTADNMIISADNMIISVDRISGVDPLYDSFTQIPVILTDSDFNRKTRFNDKGKINYNLKFDESNDKINNIR